MFHIKQDMLDIMDIKANFLKIKSNIFKLSLRNQDDEWTEIPQRANDEINQSKNPKLKEQIFLLNIARNRVMDSNMSISENLQIFGTSNLIFMTTTDKK